MTTLPDLPPHAALLLDLDGTLLDLAATPESVVVPPALTGALRRLRDRLGGALAIVTGRPLQQIDALLGDAPYAVAGEHGSLLRLAPGAPIRHADLPDLPPEWLDAAGAAAAAHPGARVERKRYGFVLHYRQAPAAGPALQDAVRRIVGEWAAAYDLLPAHMAWEVRPRGADKGSAVQALMREPPFAGRTPVYVGDDVTDEDAIRVVQAMGGLGLRVAEAFGTPEAVRAWIAHLAATV